MAAEYSRIEQTIAVDENVLFNNGCRACRKGFISHRDDSGIFCCKKFLKKIKNFYKKVLTNIKKYVIIII